MEGRRRCLRPFKRRRALTPVIVGDMLLRGEGPEADIEEHEECRATDIRADRGNVVPAGESVRVVRVSPRHTGEAQEVLREEGQVDADEGHPEMHAAPE